MRTWVLKAAVKKVMHYNPNAYIVTDGEKRAGQVLIDIPCPRCEGCGYEGDDPENTCSLCEGGQLEL